MAALSYQDRFRRLGREYLLQTSVNEANGNIICSLFQSGRRLSTQTLPPLEGHAGGDVGEAVHEIHKQYLADFDTLLGLVERTMNLDKPELIEKLGETLYHRKLLDECLHLLEDASIKYPDYPGYRIILGKAYLALGRYADAEKELAHAVNLAPDYPDYRNLLGTAYLHLRKAVAAVNEFRKAVELNVYYHNAYFNLGLAYVLNGLIREDYEMARDLSANCEETFGRAVMFNPGYATPEYRRGRANLLQGKLQEAYDDLLNASRAADTTSFRDELLEMYLRNVYGENGMTEKRISEYIERLRSIIEMKGDYADLHNEIGMAYTIMGKLITDRAITHFREALKINPEFERAARNLKLSENDLKGFEILLEAILR